MLLLALSVSVSANAENMLGVGAKAGTLGIGIEGTYRPFQFLDFRFGAHSSIWIYHHDGPLLEGIFLGISGGDSEGLLSEKALSNVEAPSYPCYLFAQRGIVFRGESEAEGS